MPEPHTDRRTGAVYSPGHRLTTHDRTLGTHATVGHMVKRDEAPNQVDDPALLRAECASWNYADGAAHVNAKRRVDRLNLDAAW